MSAIRVPTPPGASTSPAFQASQARIFCAYRATSSMLEFIPRATSAMQMVPTEKFRSLKTVKSRIGSAASSSRMMNAAIAHTANMSSATMNPESNQSFFSPRSSTSWRRPNPTTMSTSPIASIPRDFLANGASNRNTLTIRKPRRPMGRLI